MTTQSTIGNETQSLEGRSVRDIVEYSPELVNEAWCRKIFRQILQSLERQYAMHMPHRAITPDTIVFHENGEPLLAPSVRDEPAAGEADDLNALARIVHYAITRELLPTGPLHGRALEGYSDSLIEAVDRCMAPDPAERPQDIAALRDILGIVTLGPSAGVRPAAAGADASANPAVKPATATTAALPAWAATQTASAPAAIINPDTRPARGPGLGRWQRWAIAGGAAAVLAAIALVMFAEMRDSGTYDHIVLTLPQTADGARDAQAGAPAPARAQEPLPTQAPATPPAPARAAVAAAPVVPAPAAQPATPDANAENPDQPGESAAPGLNQGSTAPQAGIGTTYRLRIQPWGVVYVDGVERGVSPPVKRLTLAPGKHTLRVTNPAFQDRVLEVDTARGGGQVMVDFNDQR